MTNKTYDLPAIVAQVRSAGNPQMAAMEAVADNEYLVDSELLEAYTDRVYTAEDIKGAKADRAGISYGQLMLKSPAERESLILAYKAAKGCVTHE